MRQRGYYVQSNYLEVMTDGNEKDPSENQRHLSKDESLGTPLAEI